MKKIIIKAILIGTIIGVIVGYNLAKAQVVNLSGSITLPATLGAGTFNNAIDINSFGTAITNTVNSNSTLQTLLKGNVGAKGATGATGATGVQGIQGITGATGVTGATGQNGINALNGIGYNNLSSATPQTIGIGVKTFTTNVTALNTAYIAGNRIRVVYVGSPSTTYLEGVITTYSGNTLAMTVDLASGGSGSYSSWAVTLTGAQGIQGIQGMQGVQGVQGAQGVTGATGTGAGGNLTFNAAFVGKLDSLVRVHFFPAINTSQLQIDGVVR